MKQASNSKADYLRETFPDYLKELKRKGVTIRLLWGENIQENSDGFKYTQFCLYFKRWRKDDKISMHFNHKAGDKMMVDYAGDKMKVTSRKTGKIQDVESAALVVLYYCLHFLCPSAKNDPKGNR